MGSRGCRLLFYGAESGQCFAVERGAAPPEGPALRFAGDEPLSLFAHEPPVVQAALAEGLPDGGEKAFFIGVDVLLVEQGVAGLGALCQAVQKQMRVFGRDTACGAFLRPCRPVVRFGSGVQAALLLPRAVGADEGARLERLPCRRAP